MRPNRSACPHPCLTNQISHVHRSRVLVRNTQADILVSELLGSFGDNELSPECLDGAQKFLKGTGSLFIPY